MMRRLYRILLSTALVAAAFPLIAQVDVPRVSPKATISQTVGVTDLTIVYSRPGVRDRQIWGELVPLGELWRTGANEATTIEFSHDVKVEGREVLAGKYALFTIPGESSWTVILNSDWEQNGTSRYDEAKNVASFNVTPRRGPMQELMTFHVPEVSSNSATIELAWDELRVPFTVAADTNAITMTEARAVIDQMARWAEPYRAANWAYSEKIVNDETLKWIDHSIALSETWWNLSLKARMLAALGRRAEAVAAAERALTVAGTMENRPDTSELEAELRTWKN